MNDLSAAKGNNFKKLRNYSAVGCWLPYNAIYSRWREAKSQQLIVK